MEITLEHPSIQKYSDFWGKLLLDCDTLGRFCGRIESLSNKFEKDEDANKFKGDVFEIFCELLIKLSPIDERIGISDYHPILANDTGVDGYGKTRDNRPATVQIKYRLWDYTLDVIKEHLDNFRWTSYQKFGVDPVKGGQMLIITTGKEIGWRTLDNHFNGKVKCISRNASYGCLNGIQLHTIDYLFSLKTLVDNNQFFWNMFRKLVCLENIIKV